MAGYRRFTGAGSAIVVVIGWGIFGALAAQASATVEVSSASGFAISPSTISATSFALEVDIDGGTSISVWGETPGTVTDQLSLPCDVSSKCSILAGVTGSVPFTITSASVAQYVNIEYSAGGAVVQLTVLPEQSGGDGSGESTEGPGPILQQIPRLPGDDCSTVDRPELNWSGVSNSGWGPSWSHWANEGAGGAVCTRMLEYSQRRSRLVIAGTH